MFTKILLLIVLLCPAIIQAQTCDECKEFGYQYPYIYCERNTGTWFEKCSESPFGELKHPWKLCLPATISYDQTSLQFDILPISTNGNNITLVFEKSKVEPIIQEQYNKWVAICAPSGPKRDDNCQRCPIKVRWSKDITDFKDQETNPAFTSLEYEKPPYAGPGSQCKADCSKTFIVINNTNQYVKKSSTGYPTNFFHTSETAPVLTGFYKDYKFLDLRLVMLHEIGHLLGFGHSKKSCIPYRKGIMSNDVNDRSLTFTDYDKCMFKLLYCCDVQANEVEEPPTINSTFNIFPNPISSGVTIALSPSTAQYSKHLRVIDMGGKIVMEQQFQAGSSDCTVSTSGFSAGSYLFIMTFDGINGSFAQKVVVQ